MSLPSSVDIAIIGAGAAGLGAAHALKNSGLGVVVLDTLLVRLAFPTTAVGVALLAEQHGWGLFHVLTMPVWLTVVVAVILLDLAIYFQHVLFHAVPALWRLHRMHHADLDIDVTTGFRFHPFEILISLAIKIATATPTKVLETCILAIVPNCIARRKSARCRFETPHSTKQIAVHAAIGPSLGSRNIAAISGLNAATASATVNPSDALIQKRPLV